MATTTSNQKNKISSIATDLNMKNKDLVLLCEKLGMADKKHSSLLSSDEFSVLLNRITLDNQIVNFDEYTSGKARLVRIVEKPVEKAEKFAEKDVSTDKQGKKAETSDVAVPVKESDSKKAGAADKKTDSESARKESKEWTKPTVRE